MGGIGERLQSSLPKQFHLLGGKPIFIHTVETFLKMKVFAEIILPVPKLWHQRVHSLIQSLPEAEKIIIIEGGETRQESSFCGIKACNPLTDYVVIHDAVRPFVSLKVLQDNIEQVILHGAVDTCIPSADTLVHSKEGDWIDAIPVRREFLRGQTPQSFLFEIILKAHTQAQKEGILNSSDDCSLVKRLGYPVKVVMGSERNIKITTELDLFLAERLLHYPMEESSFLDELEIDTIKGKVFVVTGASGGIGAKICAKLETLGAVVVEVSRASVPFSADLTQHEEVVQVFKAIYEQYGPIQGLINSIGSFEVKALEALSKQEIDYTIAANLTSVIYCCQCSKIDRGGHIINIASSSYSRGRKEYPIYSAAKAAVVNFTQALAEARPDLCVNVIVPQRTNTPLRRNNFPEEKLETLLEPEEIAEKIARLLRVAKMSGTILEVRKKI
jgi:2-C-methyl-D-erythritol 4-phosphate cytidylyltransferase